MIQYVEPIGGYRPGACNIGPAEVRRRQQAGVLGFAVAIGVAALLLLIDAPTAARLLVALPVAAGFSGFIQARLRFCANYGWRGLRNLGAIGDAERVEDAEARRSDRRRAFAIFGISAAGGLTVSVAFALLPI